jgi:methylglutaconyl-CoA hydratase
MAVCDVAVGVESARFAFTEVRLGLLPATISPYVLARMGEARARRVFFSGRVFDAPEAVELGLLARCVTAEDLDAVVEREVAPYRALDRETVARAKRLCRSAGSTADDETLHRTAELLADCWERPATRAAIEAFLDGRR